MFVIKVYNKYSNEYMYGIVNRKFISNKWCWMSKDSLKINDNDVTAWYMLPYDNI